MVIRLAVIYLVVASCVCPSLALASNGIEDIGATVRDLSRGGAFIAVEPDVGALKGNPAALAFLDSARLYLDARVWHSSFDYTGALNGEGQEENYTLANLGYAEARNGFGWGVGLFMPFNSGFRVLNYDLSLVGAPAGTTDRSSTKVRRVVLIPGLAFKLSDKTAVGASVNYSSGQADFQAYNLLGDTLGYYMDDLSGQSYALRLGLYHRASEDTTVGVYWRSRTHIEDIEGTLNTGALNDPPSQVIPGSTIEGFQFPEQYGIGLSQRIGKRWTAIGEYRRMLWDKVADTVRIVPPQGEPLELEMGWSNQDVYVLGAEYRPDGSDDTVWRLGFNYAESPVPDSTINPLYPAMNEEHYTAGYERQLSGHLRLVAGVMYAPEVTRTSTADNPFNLVLGLGQPYSLAQETWQYGLGFVWDFGGKDQPAEVCEPEGECPDCTLLLGTEDDNLVFERFTQHGQ